MRPPNTLAVPFSYLLPLPSYIGIGPCPIQLVVVMAVRKAVRAATITFTATSTIRFVFITSYIFHDLRSSLLTLGNA